MSKTKLAVVPDDLGTLPQPAYSVVATLSLPGFWAGAAATRSTIDDDHRGIDRCDEILAGLAAGQPLDSIAAYHAWLGPRR